MTSAVSSPAPGSLLENHPGHEASRHRSLSPSSTRKPICATLWNAVPQVCSIHRRALRLPPPHDLSTMAESIAKTNENVARKNANEEKEPVF